MGMVVCPFLVTTTSSVIPNASTTCAQYYISLSAIQIRPLQRLSCP
jgi:hypothetical protein